MWATEDELLEQQVKLQGGKLSKHQQRELRAVAKVEIGVEEDAR